MLRRLVLFGCTATALTLLTCFVRAQITPPRMVRTPDIHGDKIVFTAEGDLWLGSLTTGVATRITTYEGIEYGPRFSPDGQWIAFTGSYDGGRDVYIMPTSGGAPRRLTYDPTGAEMVNWTPDGTKILFRSRRAVPTTGPRLYLVPAAGGVPQPLPMEKAAQGWFAADGRHLAFCRLAMEDHHWKRYHGGEANHVWIADLEKKTFRRIDNDVINEQYPVWIGNAIFYVSEKDGTANLWRFDVNSGRSTRVTSHDTYDIKAPSSDGQHIIYQWGNSLWVYNTQTGQDEQVKLTLSTDRIHARPHTLPGSAAEFSIGPTGKRLVVEGRGQLATIPAEKGEVRTIAPMLGTRSKEPAWSPDGKWIAFVSDRSGEENVWVAPAGGQGEPKPLTQESKVHLSGLRWSPDSKRLAYSDEALALWLLDIDTKSKTEVARGSYGGISGYRFSPDSRWIAYVRNDNNFVQSLYLYNVADKKATRLTFAPTRDSNPVFDPAGKYLYFLSERSLTPHWDGFDFQQDMDKTTKLYLLTLAADTPSPLSLESDEEPGSTPDAAKSPLAAASTATKTPEKSKDAGTETKAPDIKVDLAGISDRILELPIAPGNYSSLDALEGKIVFLTHEEGDGTKLKLYNFTTKKESEIGSGIRDFEISHDLKKMAVRGRGGIQIVDAGAAVSSGEGAVDVSQWRVEVDPELEWKEVFTEAWRNHRDSFYDPNLHGQDWETVRRKYEALLPSVGTRAELNEIIGDMQGEMNVSHEFVGGGYTRRNPPTSPGIGTLGADLVYDASAKAYRFSHIFQGDGFNADARSPLLTPGLNVKEGDYLFAINGTSLRADQDPYALLVGQGEKIVTLQVNSKATTEGARTVRLKAMSGDAEARYYDWVSHNREYVQKNGGPNLGYIHIPDMENQGMIEFSKQFYANLDKDGLVLDVRYNGGGIISGTILERLRRVIFEYDQPRYGEPQPYHRTAYLGRLVVLCNEYTGSDGEYFCTGFRYMKLGPTVGTRTWGGFMAVGGISAIDGGFISTPVEGSFSPDGKWLPDGYGFNPDYVVDEDPNAFVAGRDPQLDKAIELLKDEIKRDPPKWPKRIDPPSKEKAFGPNKH